MTRFGRRYAEAACAFGLAILVHLPALLRTRPLDDETYLASMGRMLRAGDVLYRDVIDRKPPLVLWAYEWLLPHSWNMQPVRLVVVCLIALNGIAVGAIARSFNASHTAARSAGALAIIGTALAGYSDAHAANFELWGLLPATLGVLVAIRSNHTVSTSGYLFQLIASGALVGIATNCKQPYVFTFVVLVWILPPSRRLLGTISSGVGLAISTVIIAGIAGWHGYWRWAWFENGDYLRIGIGTLVGLAARQLVIFIIVQWPLTTAAFFRRRPIGNDPLTRIAVVWLVASLLGVASGLRFFGHYFQQAIPPLALLAGIALARRSARATVRIVGAATFAVALWSLSLIPSISGLESAPRALAQGIAHRTAQKDRVLVWGRLPDAAVQAQRVPTGRFVHQGYLTGDWAAIRGVDDPAHIEPYKSHWHDYLQGLVRNPPVLIVDASSIVKGWERYPIARLPLQRLVDSCYRRDAPIDGLPTFRLTTTQCRP